MKITPLINRSVTQVYKKLLFVVHPNRGRLVVFLSWSWILYIFFVLCAFSVFKLCIDRELHYYLPIFGANSPLQFSRALRKVFSLSLLT